MNENMILFALSASSVMLLCVAFVYVVGIVWRVEMELDASYKLLSAALLFLISSEVLDMLPLVHEVVWWNITLHVVKFLAALSFFVGMFFMRDLIRRMDGEKSDK